MWPAKSIGLEMGLDLTPKTSAEIEVSNPSTMFIGYRTKSIGFRTPYFETNACRGMSAAMFDT